MENEAVNADEIKDEVALIREKLKARGAETLHHKPKPNRKTQSKSTTNAPKKKKVSNLSYSLKCKTKGKPVSKLKVRSILEQLRVKLHDVDEASSSKAMIWINKGRKYGPKNEQKALECYEKAVKLKPSYYLIYKDRAKLFHMLKKFEKAVENYDLAIEKLALSPQHKGIPDPRLQEERKRALQKKSIRHAYPWG